MPFAFDGKIDKLTVNLGPMQLDSGRTTTIAESCCYSQGLED